MGTPWMESEMAVKINKYNYLFAIAFSLVLAGLAVFYCLVMSDGCTISTFFFTADQQGQQLYRQGRYEEAANRFTNLQWRAASFFRASDFKQAASLYSGVSSAEGTFNYGNALVMLGQYEEAINSYDRALSEKPDWQDAEINRQIAIARAEMLKKKGGDMTGGKLGADDYVFGNSKSNTQQNEQTEELQAEGEAEMQAMWLRRVQTKPADFLRAKFAYQYSMKSSK
jgi:Ca-activated chloride channel family protein